MRITFIDGTAGFDPRRLARRPTGGIIGSLTIIPRYLAACGHDVTVTSCYLHTEVIDGVKYVPGVEVSPSPDVVVFNRNCISRPLMQQFPDAVKVWWLHDIVQLSYLVDSAVAEVDKIVALSHYCRDSYSDFYKLPNHKFEVIPNGVDKSVFYADTAPRRKNLYLYASAPIKGLTGLDYLFDNMKRHDPGFELRMYTSQKLHDQENTLAINVQLKKLAEMGATVLDPIPQHELADVMREAWCLVMPNHYPEICSNLLLQARACGLPVVASRIGSASEFITDGLNGLLTSTHPHDLFWFQKEFTQLAINLYTDEQLHERISQNAALHLKDWNQICERWEDMLDELVKEKAA